MGSLVGLVSETVAVFQKSQTELIYGRAVNGFPFIKRKTKHFITPKQYIEEMMKDANALHTTTHTTHIQFQQIIIN